MQANIRLKFADYM